jgi:hypothetical protein
VVCLNFDLYQNNYRKITFIKANFCEATLGRHGMFGSPHFCPDRASLSATIDAASVAGLPSIISKLPHGRMLQTSLLSTPDFCETRTRHVTAGAHAFSPGKRSRPLGHFFIPSFFFLPFNPS